MFLYVLPYCRVEVRFRIFSRVRNVTSTERSKDAHIVVCTKASYRHRQMLVVANTHTHFPVSFVKHSNVGFCDCPIHEFDFVSNLF